MDIVHQVIAAALLFCILMVCAHAMWAFRNARIAWCVMRLIRVPTILAKVGSLPLGLALIYRALLAGVSTYGVWFFGKLLIVLLVASWKALVAQ